MNISVEKFDESCDEACPHTGDVFIFEEQGTKLIFRCSDDSPSEAFLMQTSELYLGLFESNLFRKAAEYLRRNAGIAVVLAYNQMTGGTYRHQLEG